MRNKALLPIFLIVAVDVLGMTLILPLLPFYAEHFGATPAKVGALVAIYALCQLVAGPVLGQISDRVGRRPMLLVSQIGTLIGFFVLAYAQTLWMVFLARIIDGITAGNLSLAQAYIADVTEPQDRAKSFAIIGIAFGLGFLVGPAISGYLSQFGYQVPVFGAAGLSFLSVLATYFLLPRTAPTEKSTKLGVLQWSSYSRFFKNERLAILLAQFFAFYFAFSTFTAGFALFAERRFTHGGIPFGAREVGYVFGFAGFLGLIWQGGLVGRLVKRYGEQKLVAVGFASVALGYVFLGLSSTVPQLLLVTLISSFGNSALRPCLTSLVSQAVDRSEQGVVLGLTQAFNSVALILAPILGGFLIENGQLFAWALIAAASSGIGFLLVRAAWLPTRAHAS